LSPRGHIAPALKALVFIALTGCNAVLGIQEPIESSGSAGSAVEDMTAGGGSGSGGAAVTSTPMSDARAPIKNNAAFGWAEWPMPNPPTAGLPNSQSYDTMSLTGVVIDLITGLQWQQAVDESTFTWQEAFPQCDGLTLAGGGWRLPSRIELLSVVDYTNPNPVIDINAFPETPSAYFWSSSTYAEDLKSAWSVNFEFHDGIAVAREITTKYRVRCVR